ncbi:hypothetical protein TorRG33x02_246550 [Trema orientale]|uniref:Transmembrane protein n=1 Tax=Trema orientale TaxID=63057 RepID=A0A2P5DNN0_TREOI|nr:hypothetical protein TorRG33x02_246550 [Trema orientale]
MAVDEITEDVFSLNINDSISAQNSNNPTVQNVPMEGNFNALFNIRLLVIIYDYIFFHYVILFFFPRAFNF